MQMEGLLLAASKSGDATAVRTYLEQDSALANKVDASGTSALMYASAAGEAECCSSLLACGGDPRQQNSDGASAVGLAAAHGKPAALRALPS